jgi:hypothetical protein
MKNTDIDITIDTLDMDLDILKNKYIDALKKYGMIASQKFLLENKEFISEIEFSLYEGGWFEVKSETAGNFDLDLYQLECMKKDIPYEVWIDNEDIKDTTFDFSINDSYPYFKALYELSNNLSLEFDNIFNDLNFSYKIDRKTLLERKVKKDLNRNNTV